MLGAVVALPFLSVVLSAGRVFSSSETSVFIGGTCLPRVKYHRCEGSQGYEEEDGRWMVDAVGKTPFLRHLSI
jgi:hypothetical protein